LINSVVWILWMVAVMVFTLSIRNPFYLILLIIALLHLGHRLARQKNISTWVGSNFRFILTMILLSTLINGLFAHVGSSVLFTIPHRWPLIGGNITVESLVYGAINGLMIGALYLLFNIINLALNIKQITRLIPRAFQPIAMVVTIALTFFPSIQQRTQEIKEAQMIRGNQMKKVVDWLPILIPLLVSSLENAIVLAESMTARGFHKQVNNRSPLALVSLLLAAFAVFSGWILQLYRYPRPLYVTLFLLGSGLTVLTIFTIGKRSKITRYHQEPWKLLDYLMILLVTAFLVSFVYLALTDHLTSINFSSYPRLTLPTLQTLGIIFSLIPILPSFILSHD
jgi:energy-coupling factor transport system permease protein